MRYMRSLLRLMPVKREREGAGVTEEKLTARHRSDICEGKSP